MLGLPMVVAANIRLIRESIKGIGYVDTAKTATMVRDVAKVIVLAYVSGSVSAVDALLVRSSASFLGDYFIHRRRTCNVVLTMKATTTQRRIIFHSNQNPRLLSGIIYPKSNCPEFRPQRF